MGDDELRFFGVGLDGSPAFASMTVDDACDVFEHARRAHADELISQAVRAQRLANQRDVLGPSGDVADRDDLGQTGWAVVWTDGVTQEIKQALAPLLEHRSAQIEATRRPRDAGAILFRELEARRTDNL